MIGSKLFTLATTKICDRNTVKGINEKIAWCLVLRDTRDELVVVVVVGDWRDVRSPIMNVDALVHYAKVQKI